MDINRLCISSIEDVHDVAYTPEGVAYCKREDHHHWKYGDEHFKDRSQHGFISFGDKHLGMAVQHRVAVLVGEDYVHFWTRINRAKTIGVINTMGTTAYSDNDIKILGDEIPPVSITKLVTDPDAYIGMTEGEAKAWRDRENSTFNDGIGSEKAGLHLGMGGIGIIIIFAIGYLIFRGYKK